MNLPLGGSGAAPLHPGSLLQGKNPQSGGAGTTGLLQPTTTYTAPGMEGKEKDKLLLLTLSPSISSKSKLVQKIVQITSFQFF